MRPPLPGSAFTWVTNWPPLDVPSRGDGDRQRQHASEEISLSESARASIVGNVADDAPEIGSERLQGPVGARELLGMNIALVLDQHEPTYPCIFLQCRHRITANGSRERQNETASYRRFTSRKLAVPMPSRPARSTSARWLRRSFTAAQTCCDDYRDPPRL